MNAERFPGMLSRAALSVEVNLIEMGFPYLSTMSVHKKENSIYIARNYVVGVEMKAKPNSDKLGGLIEIAGEPLYPPTAAAEVRDLNGNSI